MLLHAGCSSANRSRRCVQQIVACRVCRRHGSRKREDAGSIRPGEPLQNTIPSAPPLRPRSKQTISEEASNAKFFGKRCTARLGAGEYTEALEDAKTLVRILPDATIVSGQERSIIDLTATRMVSNSTRFANLC